MTVDELIASLTDQKSLDPTIGGWRVIALAPPCAAGDIDDVTEHDFSHAELSTGAALGNCVLVVLE